VKYAGVLLLLALLLVAANRLFRRSARRQVADDLDALLVAHAEDAVQRARTEFGVGLDYSAESVQLVETCLAQLHARHQRQAFDERALGRESRLWGAYLGAVIKRLRPCTWQRDSQAAGEGALPLVFGQGNETFPCTWVYKRIKNGEEDNVAVKFQFLILEREKPPQGLEFKPE
jgi:hypothetical protein